MAFKVRRNRFYGLRVESLATCQLDIILELPGKKVSYRTGLWGRRGALLIKSIDVGRPRPGWAAPFPRQEGLNFARVRISSWAPIGKQEHVHTDFSLLVAVDIMGLPALSSCHSDFAVMLGRT